MFIKEGDVCEGSWNILQKLFSLVMFHKIKIKGIEYLLNFGLIVRSQEFYFEPYLVLGFISDSSPFSSVQIIT